MAPGGGDVDDEARGVRLGELGMAQLLGQGPGLLLVEAVVVELDLLVGRGAHDEEIAGRLHRTGGPSGDAGQQLAQVLTRDQLGGGGVDLLQPLGGPPELVLQGLDRRLAPLGPGRRRLPRRGGAVGGEARALAPDQPVAAALRPPGLALLLDDRAASESQDGGDLAEEALGEGAERRAPRRRRAGWSPPPPPARRRPRRTTIGAMGMRPALSADSRPSRSAGRMRSPSAVHSYWRTMAAPTCRLISGSPSTRPAAPSRATVAASVLQAVGSSRSATVRSSPAADSTAATPSSPALSRT